MEERYIKAYIGNKATEIMNNNINWHAGILAMFIGPIWFFYRKAWLPGILYIIIAYILNKFKIFDIESISIILGAITIFVANKIYIWDVKKKVNSIINSSNTINDEELIKELEEKGGTSIGMIVAYIVFLGVVITSIIGEYISQYSYIFDRLKSSLELIN